MELYLKSVQFGSLALEHCTYASLKDQADDEDDNFGWDTRYGHLVNTVTCFVIMVW